MIKGWENLDKSVINILDDCEDKLRYIKEKGMRLQFLYGLVYWLEYLCL